MWYTEGCISMRSLLAAGINCQCRKWFFYVHTSGLVPGKGLLALSGWAFMMADFCWQPPRLQQTNWCAGGGDDCTVYVLRVGSPAL